MDTGGLFLPPTERPCYSTGVDAYHRIAGLSGLMLTVALLSGCDAHDIGRPCEPLTGDQDTAVWTEDDRSRTETLTVVGQDVCMPCDELICVAVDGVAGYCSRKCEDDADCPTGFSCRIVIAADPDAAADDDHQFFADSKFCVWQSCTSDDDCAMPDVLRCDEIENSDPVTNLQICQYVDPTTQDVERPACESTE